MNTCVLSFFFSYPEEKWRSSGTKEHPAIVFVVDNSTIALLNNECGFLTKNIEALCDVGKTTKGKHKQGYIGR